MAVAGVMHGSQGRGTCLLAAAGALQADVQEHPLSISGALALRYDLPAPNAECLLTIQALQVP